MKKKPGLKGLKRKCWDLFSVYIRRRHADEGGTVECYTCGKLLHWKYDAQAGHAIGGRGAAVLFDEEICRPQCYACNAKHIGNGRYHIFSRKLIAENGMDWWDTKLFQAGQSVKRTRDDIEQLIEHYKAKVQELDVQEG